MKSIAFACDHGGLELKSYLISQLKSKYNVIDCGTNTPDAVDYPDFAARGCRQITDKTADLLILVCGTGIGISIAANKHAGIRCALCANEYDAEMARKHNDANALALGGRVTGPNLALSICNKFLEGEFEGGKHKLRVDKISAIEAAQGK